MTRLIRLVRREKPQAAFLLAVLLELLLRSYSGFASVESLLRLSATAIAKDSDERLLYNERLKMERNERPRNLLACEEGLHQE